MNLLSKTEFLHVKATLKVKEHLKAVKITLNTITQFVRYDVEILRESIDSFD